MTTAQSFKLDLVIEILASNVVIAHTKLRRALDAINATLREVKDITPIAKDNRQCAKKTLRHTSNSRAFQTASDS